MQEENIQRCRTLSYNTRKLRTSVEMHAGREHTEMQDIILQYQEVKNMGRDACRKGTYRDGGHCTTIPGSEEQR